MIDRKGFSTSLSELAFMSILTNKKSYNINDGFSVLIPDGESVFSLSVIRCLAQVPNVRINILSHNRWAPTRFSKYRADFFSRTKNRDYEKQLNNLCQLIKATKPDVVLPVAQHTIRFLSVYGEALSSITAIAPTPPPDIFDIAANKWLLSEFLKKNSIPHPSTILCQSGIGFEQRLSELSFPVLLKPSLGGYGRGIKFFSNPSDLINYVKESHKSDTFIIQTYIHGYDIDCNILSQNGEILAYSIQKGFIPGYHQFGASAGIDFLYDRQVYDLVKLLIKKLKWSGIAHIDLRYDEQDQRIKIIEINPRFWGSLLGSLISGINFPYLACLAGLKVNFPKPDYHFNRYIAGKAMIKMFTQGFLKGKFVNLRIENTSIKFKIQDPFPEMAGCLLGLYKKLFGNIRENT